MWDVIMRWQRSLEQTSLTLATQQQYVQDLRRFASWLAFHGSVSDVTSIHLTDVQRYLEYLNQQAYAVATINRTLFSLISFFDHLDLSRGNPARLAWHLSQLPDVRKALSYQEWRLLWQAAQDAARRDHGLTLALMTLIRCTGLHIRHVLALRGEILVRARTHGVLMDGHAPSSAPLCVPLVSAAWEGLADYLKYRSTLAVLVAGQAQQMWEKEPFFQGQRGPLTVSGVWKLLEKVGKQAHLATPLGPQVLQQTCWLSLIHPEYYGGEAPPAIWAAVALSHEDWTLLPTKLSELAKVMETCIHL